MSWAQARFFKAELLASQFAALELSAPDDAMVRVPIDGAPTDIVQATVHALGPTIRSGR